MRTNVENQYEVTRKTRDYPKKPDILVDENYAERLVVQGEIKMTDIVDELLRDEITVGHGRREVSILSIQAAAVIQTLRAKVEQLEREAVEHRAQIQRAQDTVLETLEDLNAALAKIDELQSATA